MPAWSVAVALKNPIICAAAFPSESLDMDKRAAPAITQNNMGTM
jgi:hypothetical protein